MSDDHDGHTVNIAGDIEAVADEIRVKHAELVRQWVGDDLALPPMVHYLAAWNTRLRRIAAGIRGTLGDEDQ